ncbi:glycogen(starch) synthase [Desulfohalotomaculum tongense]|uniref:glycosyltransferase family 4 protein n=1 Tax=Desulforadius tongensis TaxID=1216062 RepID=UPI00195B8001|nr:glycosyltransferase family 4 protein [Desulforadius tongensis]MBM7854988.1 glycogen(starch) synthase [Desulforadius tongensis]
MRVLVLSWEYPPKSVGGLAQHVYDLYNSMSKQQHEVHIITVGSPDVPEYENVRGVKVYRVIPYQVSSPDFVTWVMQLNVAMLERCLSLVRDMEGVFDVIHAHDWLVAYAARALKHSLQIPLIATIHATEHGRNNGLHNDLQRHISDIEWWLCYEAWRVIVCSRYMHGEVRNVFQVPEDKLRIIPNGVNPQYFAVKNNRVQRNDYAAPDEKIVFYVGRLVREKGVQVLLEAAPKILHYCPGTKFIIAGKGPYTIPLKRQARRMGIESRVYFTGYVDDSTRNSLYKFADVAVFPSLYEPFGIVALEAMAARTPLVVSDTGGLAEIIDHGVNGLKAYTGNPNSVADNVLHMLLNPDSAGRMKERAYKEVVEKYNWQKIAGETVRLYEEILAARISGIQQYHYK